MQRFSGSCRSAALLLAITHVACVSSPSTESESPANASGGAGGTAHGVGGAGSGGAADGLVDGHAEADHPYLVRFGRWSELNPKRPVGNWGALGIRVRFTGTSLTLHLEDERLSLGAEGTGNYYEYSLDGGDAVVVPSVDGTEYRLAEGLVAGEHELLFVRRTESKFGTTTFLGVTLDAGERLLEPTRPAHRIEVFGDSISAGLANENTGLYTHATENGVLAWGPLLAQRLDAEWHVEARGGGSFYHPTWLPMPPWFDKVLGPGNMVHLPDEDAELWDFSKYEPDVFVLALGTNDFSEMYPHVDESAYVAKYQGFLEELRKHYPKAEVFCLAPFKEGVPWDEARAYIPLAVAAMGDENIHSIDPLGNAPEDVWLSYPSDFVTGDAYHPNLAGHRKIAQRLATIVEAEMGW